MSVKEIILGLFSSTYIFLLKLFAQKKVASSNTEIPKIAPSKLKGADIALGWVNDGDGKVHLYDMKAIGNSAPKVRP